MIGRITKISPHVLFIVLFYTLSHVFFSSSFLTNWDAGQFALGTVHYDLAMHQPHPPGYFLFILAGKFFTPFLGGANYAFVFLNGLAGLASVFLLYAAVFLLSHNRRTAAWTVLLLIVNPVFWYYHLIANTYTFEALAVILTLFCILWTREKRTVWIPIGSSLSIGLLMGFRPSIILVALPLLIITVFFTTHPWRTLAMSALAGMLGFALWFFPFVLQHGGLAQFFTLLLLQAHATRMSVANLNTTLFFLMSAFYGLNGIILLIHPRVIKTFLQKNIYILLLPVAFMSAIFLSFHFGEVGYTLSIIPPLLLLFIPVIHRYATGWRIAVLAFVLATNIAFFFLAPSIIPHAKVQKSSWPFIREHDRRIAAHLDIIRRFDPSRTVVVALRGQYYTPEKTIASYPYDDSRILEYELPNYLLYDLLGVSGVYFRARAWEYTLVESTRIPIPKEADTIIILADYLHPDVRPKEISLREKSPAPSPFNYYTADLNAIDRFTFLGFSFERER